MNLVRVRNVLAGILALALFGLPSVGDAATGLVAAYSFDEGAGTTVADASGNGNTGTIQGPTWTPTGKFGAALTFDGTNDLVVINPSSSLNLATGMTLQAWVLPTAAQSGWRTIIQREVDAFLFHASNDGGALRPAAGGTFNGVVDYTVAPSALTVNAWSHLAVTWDGATLRLYVNGTQVSSKARAGTLQTSANGAGPIRIGGNSPYGEFFLGRIDEVRIYNRALSAAEIQTDMNTPIGAGASDTTPPSNPSGMGAAAVSASQVNLAWSAATDNVGVTGYRLERCQGAGCTTFAQIAAVAGTTFNNTGLPASTSYSYRVRAADAAGNLSAYSNVASATTPAADNSPPTAPTGLGATAVSATQVNLAWSAATDNVGVTGYRLERCQGAGCTAFALISTPAGTTFSDSLGLAASTNYSYRVRAADAAGNLGAFSNVASVTTPAASDTTPPTAPAGLAATAASSSQINLTWNASTDNVGVTSYRIFRCTGATCTTFTPIATSTTTSYGDIGLTASTSYRYRVRAVDAANNLSTNSNTVTKATLAASDSAPPAAPAGLGATAVSSTQVNLSWTAATDNVAVTGYQLERCQGAGCTTFALIATASGTTFNDTGLTASTNYSYRVRATDGAGNFSGYSNVVSTATPGSDTLAPTAPTGLTATPGTAGQVNLTWTAATDNVGVTGYQLERCQGAGCTTFAQIATPSGTTFSNTGLTASTSYSYRVRAADASGNLGAYSNVASATTGATAPANTGLVAAYSFDEGAGTTVADASGNGNTGTIQGPTWTPTGKFGAALTFDGTNDLVVINPSSSLNLATGMTLQAWVLPTAAQSGWRTIIQREVDAFLFHASNDGGALRPAAGGTFNGVVDYTVAPSALTVNAWSHLAVTWDGATLRLYVNGTQVSSKARAGTLQTSANGAGPIRIGGNSPYGEFFLGRIDEVRIYNRALSAAEIQTDMNTPIGAGATGSPPPPPPPPPPSPVPTVSLAASPTTVASGGSSTLTWSSTNATSCTASGAWSGAKATSGSQSSGALTSTGTFTLSCSGAGGSATQSATVTVAAAGTNFGLDFPGDGAVRRMLYWHNPFPIYDATYIFKVFPRKKISGTNPKYYSAFFWGNDGSFFWDGGNQNTYYGAHPYPIPAPNGPGQWEISVWFGDFVTGSEVVWDRWYTQAFRAWRESPSITHHEFYWDLPDMTKVIRQTVNDPTWANKNPPTPAIVMGQAPDVNGVSWGGYPGWEEFNGIIRGIQFYSGLLSVADIQSEIATPMSTTAGRNLIWYLNLNPRPSDVTDKKGIGTPHNPSWSGTTAREWAQ